MVGRLKQTHLESTTVAEKSRLSLLSLRREERTPAAKRKYAQAVEMYATSDMTIREIAKACGVTANALSAHISSHHRHLLFARYGLKVDDKDMQIIKVKPPKGQSPITYNKYKCAIEACQDLAYIEYNISQIARMFKLNGTALASQLRSHYPDVIPFREKLRNRLGIADNIHHGVRPWCNDTYRKAVEMYRDTDLPIKKVAEINNVTPSGLSQHLRYYHRDVIEHKAMMRAKSRQKVGIRRPGRLAGNGDTYGPKPQTVEKYARALELFRTTSLTINAIANATGVTKSGFAGYLHQWHRGDKLIRRGYDWDGNTDPDLSATRRSLRSSAEKYAPAIATLKESNKTIAEVAAEFGHRTETFRGYLKSHEPEIYAVHGMLRRSDGKLTKRSSQEKYRAAIQEYATSTESLKSIARRHGIIYNSISGYVTRNCPEEREMHRRLVERISPQENERNAGTAHP